MPRLAPAFVLLLVLACSRSLEPAPASAAPTRDDVVVLSGLEWAPYGGALSVSAPEYRARSRGASVTLEIGSARAAFATRSLRRGDLELASDDAEPQRDHDRLHLARERVVETWRAGGRVLEQSWSFEHAPPGTGPLAVTVAVSGVERATETARGIELAAAGTTILYTHGTWIDANGVRTPVPARWTGSEITLEVPADVLVRSAYPSVLDPLVGAPIAVAEATYVPNAAYHDDTHVVWNGSEYLVVTAVPGSLVRVSPSGTVLAERESPLPSRCSAAYLDQSTSRVVLVGSRVWLFCNGRYVVVEPDGSTSEWVDLPAGVSVADVATDGTHVVIVGSSWNGTDLDVVATRIALDGTILDPTPITVASAPGPQDSPSIAWLGSTFFVTYTDQRYPEGPTDVLGTRLSPAGVVASPDGVPLAASISFAETSAIVTAGPPGDHLLTFHRASGAGHFELHAVRLDDTGAYAGLAIRIDAVPGTRRPARVGSEWLIPFVQSHRLGMVAFAPATGTFRYEALASFSGAQFDPSIASDGTRALLAWHGETSTARLTEQYGDLLVHGAPTMRVPLTTRASESHARVDLVPGGTEYLARFTEGREPYGLAPYTRVVSSEGTPLGAPQYLDTALSAGPLAPGGAGGAYAVATTPYEGAIAFQFLDATGAPIATGTTLPALYSSTVVRDLARGPSGGYVAVASYYAGESGIHAGRFRDDGTPVDSATFSLTLSSANESDPAIGASSGGYLAAWVDTRDGEPNVYGIRLDPNGEVLDRASIAIGVGAERAAVPRVSRCGDGWLVTWTSRSGTSDSSVHWAFVSGAGVPGPVTTIATDDWRNPVRDVIAGWGGTRAVVLWARGDAHGTTEIRGRVIDATGQTIGADFVVAQELVTRFGSLVSNGNDDLQLAYLRTDPRDRVVRSHLRRISVGDALGSACTSSRECGSGTCVDGVCCVSGCGGGAPDCMACSVAAGAAVDGLCGPVRASTVCRTASGACDVADVCDGTSIACPEDAHAEDGTPCLDGDLCNGGEQCAAGVCRSGHPIRCEDFDPCTRDACDPAVGCSWVPDPSCGDAGADAGTDAGSASTDDAGTASDAGADDGGSGNDGGSDDDAGASAGSDAGTDAATHGADGSAPATDDGGVTPADAGGGCGCRVHTANGSASTGLLPLVLVAVALARRRRGGAARR
ncbi:MYXO-CTERM sorting domain-containing protein [Sandaracinus amylolyticus]|uniref:Tryptophan synthase alpha chain n=1 Tax=Sandaracinus amylolyticus TaxID=927083 RepID=A0A0F6YGY2_9BACT|nr:MYXO-CTERM sorting domain-containing protein [Sandaracinus amylolyticus]AKF05203.1 Tryptophan synthase alpha chain [Sandaracinus amylolyticus]